MTLSLYIHIPFCVSKCLYCDFASSADAPVSHEKYVDVVIREIKARALHFHEPAPVGTIYFGGGTPSLLRPELVQQLIAATREYFRIDSGAEITLEANPGTVTAESLAGYRTAGVNRLSIGVQSLDDAKLAQLGRVHTAGDSAEAVTLARSAGFDNIGIDLIHSLPGQSLEQWRQTLADAVVLQPDHISAYGLTVEEGTPFATLADRGELLLPDHDLSAAMYEAAITLLQAAGYEQYEIANFARPGRRSRHNQVYWQRGSYLGFGAGAHSFLREPGFGRRWSNPADIEQYCRSESISSVAEPESLLTRRDAMGEFLFLGLRMREGIDPLRFEIEFGISIENAFPGIIEKQVAHGLLQRENGRISLTGKGILLSNQVFIDFA